MRKREPVTEMETETETRILQVRMRSMKYYALASIWPWLQTWLDPDKIR